MHRRCRPYPNRQAQRISCSVRPDDLAAHTTRELLGRNAELGSPTNRRACFGNANGAGEGNRNVARMAGLPAGLPTSVPGVTVNRMCSGLEAVIQAARAIALGDLSIALAGGVESMTRAPTYFPRTTALSLRGHGGVLHHARLADGEPEDGAAVDRTVPLGESAELIAEGHGISREQRDRP